VNPRNNFMILSNKLVCSLRAVTPTCFLSPFDLAAYQQAAGSLPKRISPSPKQAAATFFKPQNEPIDKVIP